MDPLYIVIKITSDGRVQAIRSTKPEIPEGFVQKGELAFIVHGVDFEGRHNHEVETE